MTRRPTPDEAVELLEDEHGPDWQAFDLVTQDIRHAFLRFGRRLFDVTGTPDADGLLFSCGNGPPCVPRPKLSRSPSTISDDIHRDQHPSHHPSRPFPAFATIQEQP
ncbi:hypothetical protein [Streptomyces sp. NBC_00370]|uniref:hypothetical protein n=1 Tax=Streptomyces sp. NBC_00370 TaxID=2975728 RepID=UPI002E261800